MKKSKFQFINPYLEELVFQTNSDFNASMEEVEIQNSFQINRSKTENVAKVILTLESNGENESAPFKVKIRVASDFQWEDLSEEMLVDMLNNNAPALLLGYMRPIIANITNSSKFPVYNLPFINFRE